MRGLAIVVGLVTTLTVAGAEAADITITCGTGVGRDDCQDRVEAWAQESGHRVRVVSIPQSPNEQLSLYQQVLSAGSTDFDVLMIDVVWPGLLASHLVDLRPHVDQATLDAHFPAIVESATVDGKLVAMPMYTDAGLLYYRKDLLDKHGKAPPRTWAELTGTAKEIVDKERAAGNAGLTGFVFQGKTYEGLTCVALEWVDSFGGGTIIDGDGEITIDNPKAAAALGMARGWVGTIAPQGVLGYGEEESRGVFQSGDAVFMRNWPYAWALGNGEGSPVADKIAIATLPAGEGGESRAALGGWSMAVSRYSRAPEAAIALAKFMTSTAEQKHRAIELSHNPTIIALYADSEIKAVSPFMADLLPTFQNAVARPSRVTKTRYNQVSSEFQNAVHAVLSGNAEPEASLADLARRLDRLSRGGRW